MAKMSDYDKRKTSIQHFKRGVFTSAVLPAADAKYRRLHPEPGTHEQRGAKARKWMNVGLWLFLIIAFLMSMAKQLSTNDLIIRGILPIAPDLVIWTLEIFSLFISEIGAALFFRGAIIHWDNKLSRAIFLTLSVVFALIATASNVGASQIHPVSVTGAIWLTMWLLTLVPPCSILAVGYLDGMNYRATESAHRAWQTSFDNRRLDADYRRAFLPQSILEEFYKDMDRTVTIDGIIQDYPDRDVLSELIQRELDWNDLACLYHDKIEKPVEKPVEVASEKENFQPLAKNASRQELAGLAGLVARQIQDGQSQE